MSKRLKNLLASELKGRIEEHNSCVVVGVGPLTVEKATELRRDLREKGLSLTVVKNRVARHALADVGWDGVGELLTGPSALAYGDGGALAASKILVDWEKKAPDGISIQGGMLEGKVLDTGAAAVTSKVSSIAFFRSESSSAVISFRMSRTSLTFPS